MARRSAAHEPLADRLRRLREDAGLNWSELSALAKITDKTIAAFERGTNAQLSKLMALAVVFRVSIPELLGLVSLGTTRRNPPSERFTLQVLSDRVHDLRADRGMTLQQVAEAGGVHLSTVHLLELGYHDGPLDPRLSSIMAVARGLDVDPKKLLAGKPVWPGVRPLRN